MIYYSTFPSKTERFFIDYVWRDAALVLLAIAMVGVSACGLTTLLVIHCVACSLHTTFLCVSVFLWIAVLS